MLHRQAALLVVALGLLACKSSRSGAGEESESESDASSGAGDSVGESETGDGTETETETETGEDSDTGLDACPEVAAPLAQATVSDPQLDEASGMVRSRAQELLWVHNDSGDSARLFALGLAGQVLATVELEGAGAIDWEDLALGPGPDPEQTGDWLYVGDIGDNAAARSGITIYRLPEPTVTERGDEPIVIATWKALELSYPDGPHDAETLLVDPQTGELLIVIKGLETALYRRTAPLSSGELEQLPAPDFPSALATAGDVSPLGDFVIVRGYGDAFAWLRGPGQSVGEAMLGEPCPVPLASEQQGETLAIDPAGGYFTLSEGVDQPLWSFGFSS